MFPGVVVKFQVEPENQPLDQNPAKLGGENRQQRQEEKIVYKVFDFPGHDYQLSQ